MTRSLPLILALLGIVVGWLIRDARATDAAKRAAATRAADSVRAAADSAKLHDLERAAAVRAAADSARLDSLRQAFKARPIRDVVRWLPGGRDTIRDTLRAPAVVESVTVAAPMLRETADSLATCQFGRSRCSDSLTLSRAREAMTREALHLCRTAPPVEPQEAPQPVKWGAVGFLGGVAASALTIIAITRGNP